MIPTVANIEIAGTNPDTPIGSTPIMDATLQSTIHVLLLATNGFFFIIFLKVVDIL